MSIIAKFFPNGEFTQGVDTTASRLRKKNADIPEGYERHVDESGRVSLRLKARNAEMSNSALLNLRGCRYSCPHGNIYEVVQASRENTVLRWTDNSHVLQETSIPLNIRRIQELWGLTPLVHQMVESCETAPSRKKLEGMTRSMARNIRNAVFLMEQHKGGKDALSFLTLTLPDLSKEGLAKCCERWDYMVHRFLDWLSKRLRACNLTVQYVYCTEIQSKRLQQRGEYAPHLHVVFRGRDGRKEAWAITPKQARKTWAACIANVVDERFTRNALENLQRIKRSAARYLSKYMSKGKNCIPSGDGADSIKALRTQWGGMARGISQLLRRATKRFDSATKYGEFLPYFIRDIQELLEYGYIRYFQKGFVTLHTCPTTGMEYGFHILSGCLSTPTYSGGLDAILASYAYLISCRDY